MNISHDAGLSGLYSIAKQRQFVFEVFRHKRKRLIFFRRTRRRRKYSHPIVPSYRMAVVLMHLPMFPRKSTNGYRYLKRAEIDENFLPNAPVRTIYLPPQE
jgi:hypothetical protein